MSRCTVLIALTITLSIAWLPAKAGELCTLIVDATSGDLAYQSGQSCTDPHSPASTFKVPLALMGFDSGLLIDPQNPIEPYRLEYNAPFQAWRTSVTPELWLRNSVVWYSQVLTQRMGMRMFSAYVASLGYGNLDLSGDPGADNGLTHSWLSSSLKITPIQQIDFFKRLFLGDLPVSAAAHKLTIASMPVFAAKPGWTVHAKTGTAYQLDPSGNRTKGQIGWFAGWMEDGGRAYVFVRLISEADPPGGFASSRARKSFLTDVARLIQPLPGGH